jgi:hypothetical protein
VIWLLVFVAVVMAEQVWLSHGEPVWVKKAPLVWINDRR